MFTNGKRVRARGRSSRLVVDEPVTIDDVQRFIVETVADGHGVEAISVGWGRILEDRTGLIRGSAGSSCWSPVASFFPFVQSGLEGLGPDLVDVDAVTDLELGPPADLAGGSRGHE